MKVGTVAILGLPNAGKSTYLNATLSRKVAIVTPKAQTTREDILGVYRDSRSEIAFLDTPGILEGRNALEKGMMKESRRSLSGADAALFLVDVNESLRKAADAFRKIRTDAPILVLLNKIDLMRAPDMEKIREEARALFAPYETMECSFKEGFGLKESREWLLSRLPEGEPMYGEDFLSDRSLSFDVREVVREKLLHFLHDEVPHQAAVLLDSLEEGERSFRAKARILLEKESQKGIVVGRGGEMIGKIRRSAEQELTRMSGKAAHLSLQVVASPGWREDPRILRKLGYGERGGEEE